MSSATHGGSYSAIARSPCHGRTRTDRRTGISQTHPAETIGPWPTIGPVRSGFVLRSEHVGHLASEITETTRDARSSTHRPSIAISGARLDLARTAGGDRIAPAQAWTGEFDTRMEASPWSRSRSTRWGSCRPGEKLHDHREQSGGDIVTKTPACFQNW